jgi:ATP-dependent Clp protease ATP-binding subunit ClpA
LAIKKIVVKFVAELQTSLADKNIRLTLSEPVIDLLIEKGYDTKMGARPLSRKIDELIRVPLSRRILFDRLENCSVLANLKDETVEFVIETPMPTPVVDPDGYIILDQPNSSI